ncbi:sugar ABC transporter substrate-binding protein [Defluviitalea raffinosedens]|jgi:inositol transport system substrate-binding protein|uniref:Substrate-binding domain-containing protein n=1 Tax=Defluviitalea raffinosedens TaxID=1450156 RepID=A0A7C8LGV1_9FIRM|nr:sugar ABC transporter substrate-binding protein [Defluviitalea raffinosedens]KAE9631341.1 substrate-binding domain-containing protein [Defluviitalea raffinosedens]MBM7684891.1 inositol transport system substrate-binding protein [Defluviitalea raffinosedens]MBZ4667542.1 ABC-type sugar transport system, periplasmic component [Defluviitaleaceae bacterium]HHW67123.1 sugar ABC transporter substrate-binding protein [Candidatus Epulonipiscium sp.]
MKKRRLIAMGLSVMMTMSLLMGCGSTSNSNSSTSSAGSSTNASEASSNEGSKKTYRVAYIARAQSDSFAAWLANEIMAEAEEYDDITLDVFDGQADDEKENTAIENAIASKYDAIIVQPNNGEAQRPYVEKVVQNGIIAITTNARIDGIEGSSSVDADPYKQAAVNAQLALEQIPQNAKVVVLKGPSGNFHADERRKAWQIEFFDKRPDVQIVAEDFANWNKDEAMALMEDWVIAHGKIDAIISMNDNMAAGALEVIAGKPEFENTLVYGVDGTAEALLLIKEGKMTATCLQSAIELSELILDTVHKLLTGEEKQIDTDIGSPIITKDNVDEYIQMYKERGLITE